MLSTHFTQPATALISKRFSCRVYQRRNLDPQTQQRITEILSLLPTSPFNSHVRMKLLAVGEQDRRNLRRLGTYGFIKNPPAFIAGTVHKSINDMEDFGYLMELVVLHMTDLGLGTCWLGGSFTHSSFAKHTGLMEGEILPAVIAVGYIAEERYPPAEWVRQLANARSRYNWEYLFFDGTFTKPLSKETAGKYALPLEMIRIAPSASNKQPWRVVRCNTGWHFYLQRTPGYGKGLASLVVHGDLQRIDLGIAMCHFAVTAQELGLTGHWQINPPELPVQAGQAEYIASWIEK